MICHKILAFIIGYMAFRIFPVVLGRGEFSGASLNDITLWFVNLSSGTAYLVFWLIYIGLISLLKLGEKAQLYTTSVVFGVAYSIFEFPLSLIAKWNPSYDWVGMLIPFTVSLMACFIMLAIKRMLGSLKSV